MEKSYLFNRDLLQAHIAAWKKQQKRERLSESERELARQVGVTHTSIQNYRKGYDNRGAKVTRMNYGTALAISTTLNIPIEYLLPELLAARTTVTAAV